MAWKPGDWFAARYRIRALLGSGGLGFTYRATDDVTQEEVALKVTAPSAAHVDLLKREFVALRGLVHPSLAQVLDFGAVRHPNTRGGAVGHEEDRERAYLSTRLVHGRSLLWFAKGKRWARVIPALRDALGALSFLHAHGILHGDFTPNNVLVDEKGRGTLIDLSAARTIGADDDLLVAGTVGYIAPERGASRVNPAADVFSFGASVRALAAVTRDAPPRALYELAERACHLDSGRRPTLGAIVESLGGEPEIPDAQSSMQSAFVGRDEQIARFDAFLEDRVRGKKGLCVLGIDGPKGSGKTRLLTEFKWRAQTKCRVVEMAGRIDDVAFEPAPVLFFVDDAGALPEPDRDRLRAMIASLEPKKRAGLVLVSPPDGFCDEHAILRLLPLDRDAIRRWVGRALPALSADDVLRATLGLPGNIVALASAQGERRAMTPFDAEERVRLLEHALAQSSDSQLRIELAIDLGIAYLQCASYAKARDSCQGALADGGISPDDGAQLAWVLATAQSYLGQHEEARAALGRAEARATDASPPRRRFRIMNARGLLAYRDHRLDEAARAYRAAFEFARENRLDDLTTMAALNGGVVAHQAGAWGEAKESYQAGLRMAASLNLAPSETILEFNLAKLWADIGDFERAKTAAARARVRAEERNMPFFVASLDCVSADIALAEQHWDEAELLLERAIRYFEETGSEREAIEAKMTRLEGALHRGQADEAEFALLERRVQASGAEDLLARLASLRGERCLLSAQPRAAVEHFTQALETHDGDAQVPFAAATRARMARAYDAMDARALAREERTKARAGWERIMASLDAAERAPFRKHPVRRALFEDEEMARPKEGEIGRLRRLLGLYRRLNSAATVQEVLDATMDAAIELTSAERGFLILREPRETAEGESRLRVRAARNMDRETLGNARAKFSRNIAVRVISGGEPLLSTNAEGDVRLNTARSVHALRLKSILCVPVRTDREILGAIYLDNRLRQGGFHDEDIELLLALADQAAIALSHARVADELARKTEALEASQREIERMVRTQAAEGAYRRKDEAPARAGRAHAFDGVVGTSNALGRALDALDRVVDVEVAVLLRGESGTGKEMIARALHAESPRKEGPFVAINCGALPDTLLEAELFGYVRGAFTGAVSDKVGLFSAAHGGTLFLDEIGEMPLALQVKLLRVLQEREVRPLGATKSTQIDVRIVCATNRHLREEVERGRFREDLYYRVAVVDIELPPLRDRTEDIPVLAGAILARLAARTGQRTAALDPDALRALIDYTWPGNVRQLENVLTRAFLLCDGSIRAHDLGLLAGHAEKPARGFRPGEAARMLAALEGTGWNVSEAARALRIPRASFYRKMERYRLAPRPR